MGTYLEFDDKTGMYKSITLEQWLEKKDLVKQDEELLQIREEKIRKMALQERIKIMLNLDFQKEFCITCGLKCGGTKDEKTSCSYYKYYIDKVIEATNEMRGETE